MKRVNSLCLKCKQPLSAADRQGFHMKCMQCPLCMTTKRRSNVSYYHHKDNIYCRLHYSAIEDTHCAGCEQAILTQFVEHRTMPDKKWHPECYMINKFWNIRLTPFKPTDYSDVTTLIETQTMIEKKVTSVWTDLSSFEESSASCISDMLLKVSAGAFKDGIRMANEFIMHLEVLFSGLDYIRDCYIQMDQEFQCINEAHLIYKQVMQFFQLLTSPAKSNITNQLISVVTGLAHHLKSLIRIGLVAALGLEYDVQDAIPQFLHRLLELEKRRVWMAGKYWFKDPPLLNMDLNTDLCYECHRRIVDTECYRYRNMARWHPECFRCKRCSSRMTDKEAVLTSSFVLYCNSCCTEKGAICAHVSVLAQYLYTLKIFLSRISIPVEYGVSKQPPDDFNITNTARNSNLLRMMDAKREPQKKLNKLGSIQLGQIQQTPIGTPNPPLRISTNINEPSSISKPLSSLMRAFSSSTGDKSSIYGLYGRRRRKNDRRTSVLTLNDPLQQRYPLHLSCLNISQDYLIRHVAIIYIEPLLIPPYSQDELIGFISYTNGKPVIHSASVLWEKLITHIKTSTSNKHTVPMKSESANHNKVFGVPLDVLVQYDQERTARIDKNKRGGVTLHDLSPALAASFSENALIPTFVKTCVLALMKSDMTVEGIFRKNGNIRALKHLSETLDNCTQFDSQEAIDGLLRKETSIQLAALLKKYLRELPEPLLTFRLYKLFIRCGRIKNNKKALHYACCLLPKPNRDTIFLLCCCLKWVGSFSDRNKMDIPNLARIIAPNVLYDKPTGDSTDIAITTQDEINVIEILIRYGDELSAVRCYCSYHISSH
ncbi:hypothetical protein BDB01DRAFT_42740 [Pilobolus umbonatus]|nr:hypothetical protein BDB01DRAFT_42740 [Pilobolus umbonatus]